LLHADLLVGGIVPQYAYRSWFAETMAGRDAAPATTRAESMVPPAVATTARRPALTEELRAQREAVLFSFTDRPVIEAFGFYREAAHEAGRQE
jgi:hypothetical protein